MTVSALLAELRARFTDHLNFGFQMQLLRFTYYLDADDPLGTRLLGFRDL